MSLIRDAHAEDLRGLTATEAAELHSSERYRITIEKVRDKPDAHGFVSERARQVYCQDFDFLSVERVIKAANNFPIAP